MIRNAPPYEEICEPRRGLRLKAGDPLAKYKQKREFDETPEPEGKDEKGGNKHRFVIQRHKAKKAGEHFDLRLENDEGAMSSWSIPKHKLPSGKEKLLAVKTEDHPLEYRAFEGTIPEGEYGAGEMAVHDSGTYDEVEWGKSKIVFKLNGKKEKGAYKLFRTDGKSWMIMAAKDEDMEKKAETTPLSRRAMSGTRMPYSFTPYEGVPDPMREINYQWRPGMPETRLVPKDPAHEWVEQQEKRKKEQQLPPAAKKTEEKPFSRRDAPSETDKRFLVSILDHMIGWYPSIVEAEQAIRHLVDDFVDVGLNSTVAQIIQHQAGRRPAGVTRKLEHLYTHPMLYEDRKAIAEELIVGREYYTPKDWAPSQTGNLRPEGFSGAAVERLMGELPEQEWADEVRADLAHDLNQRGLVIDGLLTWGYSRRGGEEPPPVGALKGIGKWRRKQGYQ